jgi:hypothetical protein
VAGGGAAEGGVGPSLDELTLGTHHQRSSSAAGALRVRWRMIFYCVENGGAVPAILDPMMDFALTLCPFIIYIYVEKLIVWLVLRLKPRTRQHCKVRASAGHCGRWWGC